MKVVLSVLILAACFVSHVSLAAVIPVMDSSPELYSDIGYPKIEMNYHEDLFHHRHDSDAVRKNENTSTCTWLITLNVDEDENTSATSTRTVQSGCTKIESCVIWDSGNGGTAFVTYYEVTTGGIENTKRQEQMEGPWDGCWGNPLCNCPAQDDPPIFHVTAGSKVKVEVAGNNGLAMQFQIDESSV